MAGPWGEWKTKSRFPTLPTGPWKSRQHREIPTFPPPGFPPDGGLEKQKQGFHFPPPGPRPRPFFLSHPTKTQKGVRSGTPGHTSGFHAHSALEPSCSFMLILRLENAVSRVQPC